MRRLRLLLLGLILVAPRLGAQVTVEVLFDQDQYLANESLWVGVRITNFSGQELHLGREPDWLRFAVAGDGGAVVTKLGDPPVVEEFVLPSSQRATRRADLAPYFNLSRPGRYRVTAIVKLKELGEEINSPPKPVSIVGGAKLWEQEFGLVPEGAPGSAREIRKYALVQALAGASRQPQLYARVTDRFEARVFRVFSLCPLIAFGHPEAQVDREGRLHVLAQTGAHVFTYLRIGPQGELLVRQTYEYGDRRPTLRADAEGAPQVSGGVRVPSASDLPRPAPEPPAPTPAGTAGDTAPPTRREPPQ